MYKRVYETAHLTENVLEFENATYFKCMVLSYVFVGFIPNL